MERAFRHRFRPPEGGFRLEALPGPSTSPGWFRFGGVLAFGSLVGAQPAPDPSGAVPDVTDRAEVGRGVVRLPFDLDAVVDAIRHEQYVDAAGGGSSGWRSWARRPYYLIRPALPVRFRRHMQRRYLADWRDIAFPNWPVDTTVDDLLWSVMSLVLEAIDEPLPMVWFWPDAAMGCLLLTHDVETSIGRDRCLELAATDARFGARSSFQLVPEVRYDIPAQLVQDLRDRGCDVNVHGLNHDGHLFEDHDVFSARAVRIRAHAKRLGADGFRSPVLYRRASWLPELGFAYDMSIPNVAHLDPQRGGCCTVMPFMIGSTVELPLTTAQDYTLLHVFGTPDLDLWREQLRTITDAHGLACFNIHPDYLEGAEATALYLDLLELLADTAARERLWWPSPGEAATWWRQRHVSHLRRSAGTWVTAGPASGAVVGHVHRDGDGLRVEIAGGDRASVLVAGAGAAV